MAPPEPATKVGKGLSKKIGPLPAWAWAVLAAGGLFVGYWLMRGRGQGNADSPVETVTGNRSVPAEDLAMGNNGVAPFAPQDSLSQDVLDQIAKDSSATSFALKNIGEHLNDPSYWGVDDSTSLAADLRDLQNTVAQLVVGTTLGPPDAAAPTATTPVTKKPSKPQGVKWGGNTFQTKDALDAWLSHRGSSYKVWAQNHPEAVKQLRGPIPTKAPVKPKTPPRPVLARPKVVVRTVVQRQQVATPKAKPKPKPKARQPAPRPGIYHR